MGVPIRRYEQIASILIKYGFETLVRDILPNKIPGKIKTTTNQYNADLYKRIRLAIQELGPTFVKFAQIMSTRRELLPPQLINELKELTNRVEPLSFDSVKPLIEEQCGPIHEAFAYLAEQPFAAASLSQVHLAKLRDGNVLALKVQRPGIRETIETDLEILKSIATRLDKNRPELKVYNLPVMVREFSRQILSELDFTRDGRNAELTANNISGFRGVRVPRIYWNYTGPKVLAMEYVKGVRLDKVEAIKSMDLDPREVALRGFRVFMKQIFVDGFFHGDPHPGNLLVTQDGELVILDFGLVGILRPEKRDRLLKLLLTIVDRDVEGLIDTLEKLGVKIGKGVDSLKDDLYLAMMSGSNEGKSDDSAFEDVLSALRKYHVRVPGVAMLMIKVVLMLDGAGRMLCPGFDFIRESRPLVAEIVASKLVSGRSIRKAASSLFGTLQSTIELPKNVNAAFGTVSSGQLTFKIAHDDIDRLGKSINNASYKTLLGINLASIVLGTSLVVVATKEVLSPNSFMVAVAAYFAVIVVGTLSVHRLVRNKI